MRFGILGDAKIARQKLVPAMRKAGHEIVCLGRRNPDLPTKDDSWSGIAVASYDEMLARDDIDAVYNPLPNHLHVSMSIKAMQHGKHVLCEKPIALSVAELDQLEQAHHETGKCVYEAFMVKHHPQWKWLQDIEIGKRISAFAQFSYPPQPDGNIRNFADMGGGPVWDIGCYCILGGMMAFDAMPKIVHATRISTSELDVEKSASAIVDFGEGRLLHFSVSSAASLSQYFRLVGEEGWCALDVPFNPPEQTTGHFATHAMGAPELLSEGKRITFDPCDQYQLLVEDFALACAESRKMDFNASRSLTTALSQIISAPYAL